MQIRATIRSFHDGITPDLLRRTLSLSGSARTALLEKIGLGLVSMAKRSFASDSTLRPLAWPNKKDGTPSTLTKGTRLRKSITARVAGSRLTIGSDAAYASIHQLGGVTRPHTIRAKRKKALHWGGNRFATSVKHPGSRIPARPYLPFYRGGDLTVKADRFGTVSAKGYRAWGDADPTSGSSWIVLARVAPAGIHTGKGSLNLSKGTWRGMSCCRRPGRW